jgi:antirestriction protein ArdC
VFQRAGDHAFYLPASDTNRIREQAQFFDAVNFYRTALNELTHNADSRFMPHGWSEAALA